MKRIILAAVFALISLGAVAQQTFNQPVVAVKGEAERSVTPDRFTINVSLRENETKTDRLTIADKHKKLVAALRAVEIDPSALKADDLGNSQYKRKDTRTTITYQLKLESFEAVTRAFDAFAAAGVRQAYLAESTYSRQKEVEQELLAEAVCNARKVADVLAEAAGMEVIVPLVIEMPAARVSYGVMRTMNFKSASADVAVEESLSELNLEVRDIKLSASVNVTYSMNRKGYGARMAAAAAAE